MRKRVAKGTYINEKMEYTTVRNNKDTNGILKFEKQEVTSDLLESKEREHQTLKTYKMEKNKWKINFLKKRKQRRMLTHQKSHTEN